MFVASFCVTVFNLEIYADGDLRVTMVLSNSSKHEVKQAVIRTLPGHGPFVHFDKMDLEPNHHYVKVETIEGFPPNAFESWFNVSSSTESSHYVHCTAKFSGGVGSVVGALREDGKHCIILPIVN